MDFLPRMVRLHITPIIYLLLFSSTRIVQHIKAMGRLSGRMLRMLRVLDMERHLLVILEASGHLSHQATTRPHLQATENVPPAKVVHRHLLVIPQALGRLLH
jgi:hypothetical protein